MLRSSKSHSLQSNNTNNYISSQLPLVSSKILAQNLFLNTHIGSFAQQSIQKAWINTRRALVFSPHRHTLSKVCNTHWLNFWYMPIYCWWKLVNTSVTAHPFWLYLITRSTMKNMNLSYDPCSIKLNKFGLLANDLRLRRIFYPRFYPLHLSIRLIQYVFSSVKNALQDEHCVPLSDCSKHRTDFYNL